MRLPSFTAASRASFIWIIPCLPLPCRACAGLERGGECAPSRAMANFSTSRVARSRATRRSPRTVRCVVWPTAGSLLSVLRPDGAPPPAQPAPRDRQATGPRALRHGGGLFSYPLLVEVAHQRREHVSVGGAPPMRLIEHRDRPEWLAPGGLRLALRRTPEQIERLPRPAADAHGEGRAREGSRPMHMGADLQQVRGRKNTQGIDQGQTLMQPCARGRDRRATRGAGGHQVPVPRQTGARDRRGRVVTTS